MRTLLNKGTLAIERMLTDLPLILQPLQVAAASVQSVSLSLHLDCIPEHPN